MTKAPDTDFIYDIETYLDLFSVDITHVASRTRWIFEVSDRLNQSREFVEFIYWLKSIDARMFGYNNEGFDWPVVQHLVRLFEAQGFFTALDAHQKAQDIITGDRFANSVWPNERIVIQGDLYKIHHFDNMARSTSLKKLEINMRSRRVVDLPYSPFEPTTDAQKDEIIAYMCHDVSETMKFYHASLDQIVFRDELAIEYPDLGDVLNFNDTKIGKKFFERALERAHPGSCYERINGRRVPRQTRRQSIALRDVISPKVQFFHPEFQRVKEWLEAQVLTPPQIETLRQDVGRVESAQGEAVETKGVFKGLSATVDGFKFDFGTGGIHGSLHSTIVRSDDEWEVWDWDVASFYPNLAISNRLFPAHLSEKFCDIYLDVYKMRKTYAKGTAGNAMLKLALNGVYGDSNNKYSPFYDPQYTMGITINGQLLLCMLAENLLYAGSIDARYDGVEIVQINTDGLTLRVRKDRVEIMKWVCKQWENHTGLELESAEYDAMYIRDVNSYIATYKDSDKIKRIGAYAYLTPLDDPYTRERGWHQDHSMLVVRKAAEASLVHGTPIEEFIMSHRDPFDFMLAAKVPRSSRLLCGEAQIQNTSRYYVSTDGSPLTKIMPPLKGKTDERYFAVRKGWNVTITNDVADFRWDNINWLFYIEEARKLLI